MSEPRKLSYEETKAWLDAYVAREVAFERDMSARWQRAGERAIDDAKFVSMVSFAGLAAVTVSDGRPKMMLVLAAAFVINQVFLMLRMRQVRGGK